MKHLNASLGNIMSGGSKIISEVSLCQNDLRAPLVGREHSILDVSRMNSESCIAYDVVV